MDKRLRNKVALITGGTTGIGLATAKRFAAEGADVVVTGRNPETLEAARKELGDRAKVVESDAADEQKIAKLFETIGRKHGRLDILFLNAGIANADFDDMWILNVRALWLALKHAIPILSEGAAVIVNTSVAHQQGFEAASAYGATKGALQSIVRVAARELAGRNVRVNAISPGPIETPDELASVATFLASRDSSYITGSELAADMELAKV